MPCEPTTLFAVADQQRPREGMYVETCIDSGCGRSAMGAKLVAQLGYKPTASMQSNRGHHFTGLGGEQYRNQGEYS